LDQAEPEGKLPAERREVGVDRKERLIGRKRHNRDVDEVCLVRDRKPIDPDAALVERLRHREEAAVTALVAAHGDRVYRLAIRLTGDSSDAEEVMQDAFWSATRRIDSFPGTAAFLSWLYRITLNSAHRKLRGRRREGNAVTRGSLLRSRTVLRAAIDNLPDNHRTTFVLHDLGGLSSRAIAEALQLKLGAVKSRVQRARRRLRKRLAAYMSDPAEECLRRLPC
jgi:RNA polymerase sigma-70 factor, ECF subfamily